jgi:transposase InsO family protein
MYYTQKAEIQRIYDENFQVYGARKVWRQLQREGFAVARCKLERPMRALGMQGVRRGARCRTTVPDDRPERPVDHVSRQFQATRSNDLRVADFTYGAPGFRRRPGRRCRNPSMSGMHSRCQHGGFAKNDRPSLRKDESRSGGDPLYAGGVT